MATAQNMLDPEELDAGAGMQPVDINSIGVSRDIPRKTIALWISLIVILILLVIMTMKYWALPRINEMLHRAPTVIEDERPLKGQAKLPDATTPMNLPVPITPGFGPMAGSGEAQTNDRGGNVGSDASKSKNSKKGEPRCAITAVVDRQNGLMVRNAQGEALKIDCNGTVVVTNQGSSEQDPQLIPAPNKSQVSGPTGISGAHAQTWDRYGGDSTLSTGKKSSGSPNGPGYIASALQPSLPMMQSSPSAQIADALGKYLQANNPSAARPAGNGVAFTQNPVLNAPGGSGTGASGGAPNTQGAVGGLLNPTSTPKALAVRSIEPSFVVPKGDSIDCAMTTRIVTEISGFTSCLVSSNVYSADGKVLLIERMSEVQGEYAAIGAPGQRRVYVLWSRIRKPGGVTIDIASPSTDQLGAAGIDGVVDNRWFERIGSAYMLSIFKDFLAAQANSGSSNGTLIYQNSLQTSNSLAEKVLAQSINIKPIVYANQGDRVAIYVARDLDFSNVYTVRRN